ncbi:MAG TPA: hypothetical protein VIF15_20395 [Polyangiaceae bacterium]|jgi:hypothetical protein
MTPPRDPPIDAVTTAWRPRDAGGIRAHPAWFDLDDGGRLDAYETTRALRTVESALDPAGLSTTARAVLERVRRAR